MFDYEERRKYLPTFCPKCMARVPQRFNQQAVQKWGDVYKLNCSDYSLCDWTMLVHGYWRGSDFVITGSVGSGGWEGR